MLDIEFDDFELGSQRPPTQWVAVAPPVNPRHTQRSSGKHRQRIRVRGGSAAAAKQTPPGADTNVDSNGSSSCYQLGSIPGSQTTNAKNCESRRSRRERLAAEADPAAALEAAELTAAINEARNQSGRRVPGQAQFNREHDDGNVEYKLLLRESTPIRFQQLVSQLKYRLSEGNGEAFYYIGVEDDGYPRGLDEAGLATSLATLTSMAKETCAASVVVRTLAGGADRKCAIVRLHRLCGPDIRYTDLRVAVAGSVDSGKSTLVAVLTHGVGGRPLLDNGHGSARMAVFRHKHEVESGRTSSISQQTLGYDEKGRVLNYAGVCAMTPAEVSARASRVLRLIDLGGHSRYLKTALYGMTCMLPDYMLLAVCAVRGLSRLGREHLAVALALEVPFAVVLTKVDLADQASLDRTLTQISDIIGAAMRGQGIVGRSLMMRCEGATPLVETEAEAAALGARMGSSRMSCLMSSGGESSNGLLRFTVPVFLASSVSGASLPLLHTFLNALQPLDTVSKNDSSSQHSAFVEAPADLVSVQQARGKVAASDEAEPVAGVPSKSGTPRGMGPTHFQVDHQFDVKGVGSVLSGTVVEGSISVGNRLLLGPDSNGHFTSVAVTCIQRTQVPVSSISPGQSATLAIHPVGSLSGQLEESIIASVPQPSATTAACPSTSPTEQAVGIAGPAELLDASPYSSTSPAQLPQPLADTALRIPPDVLSQAATAAVKSGEGLSAATKIPQGKPATVPLAGLTAAMQAAGIAGHGIKQGSSPLVKGSSQGDAGQQPLAVQTVQELLLEGASDAAAADATDILWRSAQGLPEESAFLAELHAERERRKTPWLRSVSQPWSIVSPAGSDECVAGGSEDGAAGSPGRSEPWPIKGHLSCQRAPVRPGSAPTVVGSSTPNHRKGAVLLDAALQPRTAWRFEAVMVLLNGHWPPRGLISGRWPPEEGSWEDTASGNESTGKSAGSAWAGGSVCHSSSRISVLPESASFAGNRGVSDKSDCGGRRSPSCESLYAPVVHTGSIRQAAHVMSITEIADDDSALGNCMVAGCDMGAAIAAAAALLELSPTSEPDSPPIAGSPSFTAKGTGCVVLATFQFVHRAEWLQPGARLILRDRGGGCIAGAGVVRAVE